MHRQDPHTPQLPARIPQQPEDKPRTLLSVVKQGPWMRDPWKRMVKIGGAVVGVLVLLLIAVNIVISADWVKSRVAARIKEQTGRDLTVNGSTMLLFTPDPHVIITEAKISDPNAQGVELSIAKLTLDLSLGELFSRQVDAERVTLVRPVLTVPLGEDEQPLRWGGADEKPTKIRFARAEVAGAPSVRREIRLKDMRIEDGTVVIVYDDEAGERRRIEHINAKMSLPEVTAPLIGSGKFDWKDQTVDFSFEITTPADLRAKRPARLQLALDTPAIAARFDGSLAANPQLSGQGHVSAKASSIPSVLAWMRESQSVSAAIGGGELASDVSWTKGEIAFTNARFALEYASGQGQAVVALRSPRPHIRAALALDHLDLNPFLAKPKKRADAASAGPAIDAPPTGDVEVPLRGSVAEAPVTKTAETAEMPARKEKSTPTSAAPTAASKNRFEKPAAEVETVISPLPQRPVPAASPSSQAINAVAATTARVSPAAFDANVNLNVRQTRIGHLDIGPSSLGLAFHDGVMNATLGGMELYDGHASGKLTIDASKPIPTFDGDFRLEGVQAKPLLTDAAQFSMIDGSTKLALQISGDGEDVNKIKSSLRGQGSVVVSDGSIEGIDITAFISALGQGDFDLRQGPDAKTTFSDLGGSFVISDGVAETHNLKMVSPLLKVSAEGTVDIARSSLDILAHPKIIEGPEGKSGANDLAGLTVPVRIEGPLEDPRIAPEIGSVLANPEGASKTVNKIGEALQKKFKGKPVGEAIGRFLGNVQIGGERRKPAPQALAGPQAKDPESGQGDADDDEIKDPELRDILR
jgi:AsmA protein